MTIVAPAETSGRAEIADWIETRVLTRAVPRFSRADLRGWLEIEDSPEPEQLDEFGDELEISDLEDQGVALAVYEELWWRQRVLGENYPFELRHDGNDWVLELVAPSRRGGARVANEVYSTCLLMAAIRKEMIQYPKGDLTYKPIDSIFQSLTVAAMRAWIGGEAYWFGSPRPDGTTTLVSGLEELIRRIGYGKLKDPLPASRNNRENDGGVDVVGWRHFGDRMSALIVYGQAASGKNYKGKDVGSRLVPDFKYFFSEFFSEQFVTALFIPFTQHDMWRPLRSEDYELAAQDLAMQNEARFGLVFDRLRLSELGPAMFADYRGENAVPVQPDDAVRAALAWSRQVQRSAT